MKLFGQGPATPKMSFRHHLFSDGFGEPIAPCATLTLVSYERAETFLIETSLLVLAVLKLREGNTSIFSVMESTIFLRQN